MNSDQIKETITNNAAEAARLHQRIHDTFWLRDEGAEQLKQWEDACSEFHARYDALAFPGGYSDALERIASGDPFAMETGLCFLEIRPYFFRSGYMFKDILRKCKHAPLSESQAARLATVIEKFAAWRAANPRPGVYNTNNWLTNRTGPSK